MRKQNLTYSFAAPPDVVYKAMLSPELLPHWRVPDNMTMTIHEFSPIEGGHFRISLSYDDVDALGKSTRNTDTYQGHFKSLIPNEKIVEETEFETTDAAFKGKMTITTNLNPVGTGTDLVVSHENLPEAVPEDQNEAGWKMSFRKLAKLIEPKS